MISLRKHALEPHVIGDPIFPINSALRKYTEPDTNKRRIYDSSGEYHTVWMACELKNMKMRKRSGHQATEIARVVRQEKTKGAQETDETQENRR